jgi:hypothetical protein
MNKLDFRFGVILLLGVMAGLCRIFPHALNFAPSFAMTVFAAAYAKNMKQAFLVGFFSLFIGDLILNNFVHTNLSFSELWTACLVNYAIIGLVVVVSKKIFSEIKFANILLAGISASILFFLVSNLAAFFQMPQFYTRDLSGLMNCYVSAIPFFRNTFFGDMIFTGVLFGVYEFAKLKIPRLA